MGEETTYTPVAERAELAAAVPRSRLEPFFMDEARVNKKARRTMPAGQNENQ